MFPVSFDKEIYKTHQDLKELTINELRNHYITAGKFEGRYSSEIITSEDVSKFIDLEKTLLINHETDFSSIEEKHNCVLNKFNLNKELDIIGHFKKVYNILEDDGYYIINILDKNYTSDHFIPETDILEVLEYHFCGIKKSSLKSFLQRKCYQTHNDEIRHWANDHGKVYSEENNLLIKCMLDKYLEEDEKKNYINYYFTFKTFKNLLEKLIYLELLDFKIHRFYPTIKNFNEFTIVLKK